MYALHEVSVKLALYSYDGRRVLVMHYPKSGRNGLPGGHVDRREQPDVALARELQEELGVTIDTAKRRDFFRTKGSHFSSGRLILGYTAVAPEGFTCTAQNPKHEYDIWVTKDELRALPEMSDEYKTFTLAHWPHGTGSEL